MISQFGFFLIKMACMVQIITELVEPNKVGGSRSCRKQFSPIVFYGSPRGVPPKRQSRLLRLLHEIRFDLTDHTTLESSRYFALNEHLQSLSILGLCG